MLHTQTVNPELLELLKKIMSDALFFDFNLVGGTALALQIGHRNSVDIDLFGNHSINENLFVSKIEKLGKFEIFKRSTNILISSINGVKTDFVNYKYELIDAPVVLDDIRMVYKKDIAAMKLNAIMGRGSKKDFIDLYYLMKEFPLEQMLEFYLSKYPDGALFMVLKNLTYFNDADSQLDPIMFDNHFNWEACKQKISEEALRL